MSATAITGIVIIALIIVPIWYLIHSQGAGKRKMEKELATLGQKGEMSISEHEAWSNKVIGLDREHEKAAFFVQASPQSKILVADLKLFSRCQVERNLLETQPKGNAIVYSSIRIRFIPREKATTEVAFPLFTDTEDMTLSNELQLAEEWSEKFNIVMKKHN